jgi:hypothetical protein
MTSSFSIAADAPVITAATLGTSATVNFSQSSLALAPAITNYQYSTDNGTNWTAVSPAATTSPLTITGLSAQTNSIMIRAVNSVGNSCPSNNYISCTPTTSTFTVSACNSYTWVAKGNTLYTASNNTDTIHLTNAGGCDSLVTLNLTIKASSISTTDMFICPSALPYSWNGLTFTTAGTQTKTGFTNAAGCDSSASLTVTVKAVTSSSNSIAICPSALPYNWNGLTFTTAGTQTAYLTNAAGCDSAASLTVTLKATSSSLDSITINASQLPYSWNGLTFNGAGTQTAYLTNVAGCDSAATLTIRVSASTAAFNLKAMLQGLYLGNGKMIAAPFSADGISPMNIADTITVELRANTSPFSVVHTIKGLLDTAGNATITLPSSVNGNSYYVVVGHRNSISAWSANPVIFSVTTNYDFTNAITKAYGSNMAEDGGVFMLFSGDINQDGSIDFSDYPDLDISSNNGDLGYYVTDLNGDASVDFSDYPTLDINSNLGVLVVTP